MSVERARELIEKALADPALIQRFAAASLEERGQIAGELGYGDCTLQDFQTAAIQLRSEHEELSDEELDQISGGATPVPLLVTMASAVVTMSVTMSVITSTPKNCFVVSACADALGRPEDWALRRMVLAVHRAVEKLPEGPERLREYTERAPDLVAAINRRPDARTIYEEVEERLIGRCDALIRAGQHEAAGRNFIGVVAELGDRYLIRAS